MAFRMTHVQLGEHQTAVDAALADMNRHNVLDRIGQDDTTVWSPDPTEIGNRLGWLRIHQEMATHLGDIASLVDAIRADGYTHALLLGMGGSSLAPEVFRQVFLVREGYLDLAVLDSTDPAAVQAALARSDPAKTLYIVSTKSGSTVETLSLFKYFYNQVVNAVGADRAGQHFIAITDPGSPLADIARQHRFRLLFLNNPNIGGRYSALSFFGLVPAALVGVDMDEVNRRASQAADAFAAQPDATKNTAAQLGVTLAELARAGRDKLTLLISPVISPFGFWVEQLVAESTGKHGVGIVPVVDEPAGFAERYGDDRLFVHIRLEGDDTYDDLTRALAARGQPVVRIELEDAWDLISQFYLWAAATAIAGYRLGINPFDQPDVESAKTLARRMVDAYRQSGQLPATEAALTDGDITVYGEGVTGDAASTFVRFLSDAPRHSYVSLQAYLPPTTQNLGALRSIMAHIRDRFGLATTASFGPRFLHSTGQLHKGGAGNGVFIQLTADDKEDLAIPDEAGASASGLGFGVLKAAQSEGDRQALLQAGRRVLRFHLGSNPEAGLERLKKAVEVLETSSPSRP